MRPAWESAYGAVLLSLLVRSFAQLYESAIDIFFGFFLNTYLLHPTAQYLVFKNIPKRIPP